MKMKKLFLITLGVCVISLIAPSAALAAKADGKKAKLHAKYDKNSNGTLDADEKKAMQDDFAKDKEGELKAADKDGDGKLSDAEMDAVKPGNGKAKDPGASKGKKKNSAKPAESEDGKAKKEGEASK